VLLYSPGDILTDRVVYGSAPSGKSFSRGNDGVWSWTKTITKGSSNVIVNEEEKSSEIASKDSDIVWKTSFPKTAEVGKEVTLSVEGTKDKSGGTINFTWSFSDTTNTWSGAEIKKIFNDEGKVTGTITASSTNGIGKKTFTITINPAEIHDTGEIKISEVLVNPEGADKDEFIELYNPLDRIVSLNGWEIRTKNGKKFIIEDAEISSDEYLVFKQSETKLSLNNTDEMVKLFDADEKSIDSIRITKSPEGESYSWFDPKWEFADPTPGKANKKALNNVDKENDSESDTKTTKPSSKTSTGTKALGSYEMVSITEARPMVKGTQVIVQGTVVSKPGAIGAKTFYIMDDERGIAVYAGKKDLPSVKIGDQVEVQATISSAYGAPRLNARTIVIISSGEKVEPESVEDEIDETMAGHLVTLQGEVTKSQATSAYLDSGFGEVLVAIRKSAGLKKADFVVGDQVEITGIVEQTKDNEWQVVPREKDDVKILEKTAESVVEESKKSDDKINEDKNKTSGSSTMPYVEMGASGVVGALLVRILGSGRGMLMIGGLKKLFVKKEDEDDLV
jgi:DNA/RNA endonuclease YhcR with UshA esterase domain